MYNAWIKSNDLKLFIQPSNYTYHLETIDFTGCHKLCSNAVKYLHGSRILPNLKLLIFDNTNVSLPYGTDIKIN